MPLLNKLKTSFKDKDILFLSFANEDSTKIREFLKTTRFNFKHIPNGGRILIDTFKLFSIWPTTIIIDKEGLIRFIKVGELNDKIDFHKKLITKLLRQKLLPTGAFVLLGLTNSVFHRSVRCSAFCPGLTFTI
jgi:hypothetical protein